jgi:DNA-binding transcriptional regulator YiaG
MAPGDTLAARPVQCRTTLGLAQGVAAAWIGVDPSTLARWERGEREPSGSQSPWALRFVTAAEAEFWSSAIRLHA